VLKYEVMGSIVTGNVAEASQVGSTARTTDEESEARVSEAVPAFPAASETVGADISATARLDASMTTPSLEEKAVMLEPRFRVQLKDVGAPLSASLRVSLTPTGEVWYSTFVLGSTFE
jgi:hypothetical protein